MTTLTMLEIDGTMTRIEAMEADEGFMHLQGGALAACTQKGLHLYKSGNEYYLADEQKQIVAVGMTTIKSYISYFVMK